MLAAPRTQQRSRSTTTSPFGRSLRCAILRLGTPQRKPGVCPCSCGPHTGHGGRRSPLRAIHAGAPRRSPCQLPRTVPTSSPRWAAPRRRRCPSSRRSRPCSPHRWFLSRSTSSPRVSSSLRSEHAVSHCDASTPDKLSVGRCGCGCGCSGGVSVHGCVTQSRDTPSTVSDTDSLVNTVLNFQLDRVSQSCSS